MTKKIFKGILISSLLTMLACLVFIIGIQYKIYEESRLESLSEKANLISISLKNGGIEQFSESPERITLIGSDGKVLYDNKYNAEKMKNHKERKEIKEALKSGVGFAVRQSETLRTNTCYYSVRLENGSILRVADTGHTVGAVLVKLLRPLAVIAVFVFIIATVLASFISKKILKPINSINLETLETENSYEELAPFITKINIQKDKINRQIAELTRSRKEFEIIAENMSEGLVLTDINGHILTHNTSVERIFGVNSEINGENILILNRGELFREILGGIKENRRINSVLPLDGMFYEITSNPVYDENGDLCGAVVLAIDITEKEKREKLRREFTSNVSHELKTPLTSILGISDMLKNGMVATDDVGDFATDIYKEAERLISLVNDIIKLSRLDENVKDENRSVDLMDTAKEVSQKLCPIAATHNINISVIGERFTVNADESLIFEMIYNLCDNAIKYNKPGGKVKIEVGVLNNAPFVCVKDTGIGIAKEHHERIFERFYRVDKSRSKQSGGTGLGLSIVKHIAQSVGGIISIKSEPEKGTEIRVDFIKK